MSDTSKTRIMVSSTCYDLAEVRESLRKTIASLGHDALLSESLSFPVNPDHTAIANCKKNVEENTDILLLIIGGKRGSLGPDGRRSVTNLEYDTAQAMGIPCFVFIYRDVDTVLPLWKKNPSGDFTPIVDSPEVFKFIEAIRAKNHWTFTFQNASDIEECLRTQISTMLRGLLKRNRANTLDPLAGYAAESSEAQRIAREKPQHWEYLLTAELLTTKLAEIRRRFERQKSGLLHIPSHPIVASEFLDWAITRMDDLIKLVTALQGQIKIIEGSWGPPGKAGDVHEIKRSVDDFIRLCGQLVDWEGEVLAASPPEPFVNLKNTMNGMTERALLEMERFPKELMRPFEGPRHVTGVFEINLRITFPPMDAFNVEMAALRKRIPVAGRG